MLKIKYFIFIFVLLLFSCNKKENIELGQSKTERIEISALNISIAKQLFEEKSEMFPDFFKPTIDWKKAKLVGNSLEIQLKSERNSYIVPAKSNGEDGLKSGVLILKIPNIEDPMDIYIYSIIPEDKTFFYSNCVSTTSLKNSNFSGVLLISRPNLIPFVSITYKNGMISGSHSIKNSEDGRENSHLIDKRWCIDYFWIIDHYSDGVYTHTTEEYAWTDCFEDDGISLDCITYPWLCDLNIGDSEIDNPEPECECEGPLNLDIDLWHVDIRAFFKSWGYVHFYLDITNMNCDGGTYNDHIRIEKKVDLFKIFAVADGYELWHHKIDNDECKYIVKYRTNMSIEGTIEEAGLTWPISRYHKMESLFGIY